MLPFLNPMLIGSGIIAKPGSVVARGLSFNNFWIVPLGVTSICVCLISAGGNYRNSDDGQSSGGGGGGGLVYANNIPVTPGERLDLAGNTIAGVRLSRGGTLLLGVSAGTDQPGTGTNGSLNAPGGLILAASTITARTAFQGGSGRRWNGATRGGGGGAPSYSGNGSSGSSNSNTNGAARSLNGNGSNLNLCGAGTGLSPSFGGNPNRVGGIRIIWGEGRSYPSNALDV